MTKYTEQDLLLEYIDGLVDTERLKGLGWKNGTGHHQFADCDEYIVSSTDIKNNVAYQDLFILTPALRSRWECRGIEIRLYLYVRNKRIAGGHIYKYSEGDFGHFKPSIRDEVPTQQELRIIKRVLDHLTPFA